MAKSKYQKAIDKFRWSDPGCDIAVIPVAGDGGWSLVATWLDKPVNRVMYGQVLVTYTRKPDAEKARAKVLDFYHRQMGKAYP